MAEQRAPREYAEARERAKRVLDDAGISNQAARYGVLVLAIGNALVDERRRVAERCAEIAVELRKVHQRAYENADKVNAKDACEFIAGLRDGSAGVGLMIRREFGLETEVKG